MNNAWKEAGIRWDSKVIKKCNLKHYEDSYRTFASVIIYIRNLFYLSSGA